MTLSKFIFYSGHPEQWPSEAKMVDAFLNASSCLVGLWPTVTTSMTHIRVIDVESEFMAYAVCAAAKVVYEMISISQKASCALRPRQLQ